MAPISFRTSQPFKAFYIVYFLISFFVQLPIKCISFLVAPSASGRTYRESLVYYIVGKIFALMTDIELHPSMSLEPGRDGTRFITIQPANEPSSIYKDIAMDAEVEPVPIGAMWFPRVYSPGADHSKKVVLHFHGGAYVLGGVRPADGDFPARLAKGFNDGLTLHPQYRLAWGKNCHFPAALQDAITSYAFLLAQGIPATNIVFSGDSAGGNLALALLRYIEEHSQLLPRPAAVWLWSPWVDMRSTTAKALLLHRNQDHDWIPEGLGEWGIRDYIPLGMSDNHPYLTPLGNEFKTSVPVFIQTADAEILHDTHMVLADGMRKLGNKVGVFNFKNAGHDPVALAPATGSIIQAEAAIAKAVEAVTRHN